VIALSIIKVMVFLIIIDIFKLLIAELL